MTSARRSILSGDGSPKSLSLSATPDEGQSLPSDLVKELILLHHCGDGTQDGTAAGGTTKRIPAETAKAAAELLRLFVLEARSRATTEAECDQEGNLSQYNKGLEDGAGSSEVAIRAEHITKIAAELLMDFS
uniref:Uncharacterized protein n=1 Tax=Craspedostauros australis TaxID=1486917 RepID=A0A7R9ZM38_9STRA|mmetsp:Transcript_16078/g.44526  ORF Transcript_16078/g.44526 Transcript_16078/m.44526 type:complete len:132 (+) Transcript_16078:92-487(+)